MADKDIEEIEEPTMEDLEEDLDESEAPQEEEEKEEVETESLEARVEKPIINYNSGDQNSTTF